jgi:hypothetical protein
MVRAFDGAHGVARSNPIAAPVHVGVCPRLSVARHLRAYRSRRECKDESQETRFQRSQAPQDREPAARDKAPEWWRCLQGTTRPRVDKCERIAGTNCPVSLRDKHVTSPILPGRRPRLSGGLADDHRPWLYGIITFLGSKNQARDCGNTRLPKYFRKGEISAELRSVTFYWGRGIRAVNLQR